MVWQTWKGLRPCARQTPNSVLYWQGELPVAHPDVHKSIIGSRFTGHVLRETRVGNQRAVVPEIVGSAHITGHHTFVVDPDDPIGSGFPVR